MKSLLTRTRIVLLAAVLTLTAVTACGHKSSAKAAAPVDAVSAIRQFYTEYIEEWLSDDADFETRIEAVKERHLSTELLDRLQRAELDFDPFLLAQDCDRSMLEKLTVEPADESDNAYIIGLWDSYNSQYSTVVLRVDTEGTIADISSVER